MKNNTGSVHRATEMVTAERRGVSFLGNACSDRSQGHPSTSSSRGQGLGELRGCSPFWQQLITLGLSCCPPRGGCKTSVAWNKARLAAWGGNQGDQEVSFPLLKNKADRCSPTDSLWLPSPVSAERSAELQLVSSTCGSRYQPSHRLSQLEQNLIHQAPLHTPWDSF